MAIHNDLGKEAEQLAEKYFVNHGYEIVAQNYRFGKYEIDIIATKDDHIHFIEVKCRKTNRYGFPEESVTKKKLRCMMHAANEYLYQNKPPGKVQFDVLAITMGDEEVEYFLIEDVTL